MRYSSDVNDRIMDGRIKWHSRKDPSFVCSRKRQCDTTLSARPGLSFHSVRSGEKTDLEDTTLSTTLGSDHCDLRQVLCTLSEPGETDVE